MFDRYFSLIFDLIKKRKKLALVIIAAAALAAAAGLGLLDFDGSIELMLPDRGDIHRTIDFLRNSNISDKIIISLSLVSGDRGKKDLISAVKQLEDSLTPPLFTRTVSGVPGMEIMEEILAPDYFPRIATEKDLQAVDKKIDPAYISQRIKEIYRQMLMPQSMFAAPMYYSDPLGIRLLLLDKLKTGSVFTDYRVRLEDGYFLSPDERHAMIIADTPVPLTDSSGSKRLLGVLKGKISQLPAYISADIIGGHLHTVSNEKVIKRDIQLAIGIASTAFLLLFLIVFRDIKAVFVFLIPVFSVVLSMNVSSLIMGGLSYWVAGLGTVIAGISVDYGIHIFFAVRRSGNAQDIIRHVAKPVSIGAATTAGIFAAFFFSDIEGYHQLALFSIISIAFSLALAVFVLPHFLSHKKQARIRERNTLPQSRKIDSFALPIVVLWAVLITAAAVLSFNLKFDSDIIKLDGSEPAIFQAEENFRKTWGGRDNQAILVVSDRDYEKALEKNDIIYTKAVEAIGGGEFTSLSLFRPSSKTGRENMERWNKFWREGRESRLKMLLKKEGSKYGFTDSAFSPFFDNLYVKAPAPGKQNNDFRPELKERFVQKDSAGYKILSFFPDKERYVNILSGLSSQYPGTFIVSRKALSRSISGALSSEVKLFAAIATIFIVLLTFLFLRNVKKSVLALVPVITNVFMLSGVMSLFGLSLNIANLIAAIVSMGLCIDYGIFMTYGYEHELKRSAALAVAISAVTTVIGAGVLLFARHPALFSIGITLVTGVTAGYISSILVIPSLEKIMHAEAVKR